MASYYEPKRGWRYDFQLFGQRHRSPRGWPTKRACDEAEAVLRRTLQRQQAGLEPEPAARRTPTFSAWAGEYFAYVTKLAALGHIKRPEAIDANLRSVLRFWGKRPTEGYVHPTGPYHHLTLADPILDPSWLQRFDAWMTSEGLAGSTRNHYQSTLSGLYKLALHEEYRHLAGGITRNPFVGRPRARWRRRTATLTPAQVQAWLQASSYYVRLAVSLAALAPKLRLANILALRWQDVDLRARTITVWDHKTDHTGHALVTPITEQLQTILVDARARHPHATHVVIYRGRPVKTIEGGLSAAAKAVGLTWGRSIEGGVTFHSLRHSVATWLPRLGVGAVQHQAAIGHEDFDTTLWYTHLTPDDQRETLEALSAHLPIVDTVTAARLRPPAGLRPPRSAAPVRGGTERRALSGLRRGPQTARPAAPSPARPETPGARLPAPGEPDVAE